jgi:hypothetical protein
VDRTISTNKIVASACSSSAPRLAGRQYFQAAAHSDGCVAARLRFWHSLWHAAPCRNELFSPVAEASSKSFAHLPRHGPRRRPTSGKPSSQPGEPTMPLTCIRKRSTDGHRCEGTWACACGSKDRLGIPRMQCDHTFLRGNSTPIENLPPTRVLIRVCNRLVQEHHRTGLSREQMSLWLAGYPKRRASTSELGQIRTWPIAAEQVSLSSTSGHRILLRHFRPCAMCGRLQVGKENLHVAGGSVQPCVRPLSAVHMTAGHNALRGSGPGH